MTPGSKNTQAAPTAAVLLIGNELLSGRTRDSNLSHIGQRLSSRGIRLMEARVIADVPERIVSAVNELRGQYDYLFTTGGIGPTHDDITADCMAEAFGVALPEHPEAARRLREYFASKGIESNADRMRMARIPEGATLVDNPVSIAPGFHFENVFVFAGVPKIMRGMLESVIPTLREGPLIEQVSLLCNLPEGMLATPLRELQADFPDLDIGSYPGQHLASGNEGYRVELVARGTELQRLESVQSQLRLLVEKLGGETY